MSGLTTQTTGSPKRSTPAPSRAGTDKPAPSPPAPAERIRARAYEIYLARRGSGTPGDALADWLQAERELNGSTPAQTPAASVEVITRPRSERLPAGST